MTKEKLMSMSDAVEKYVHHGDTLYLGGFIQNEPFAAAHEIIRQGKKGLTVSKCAGVTITDQLIGAGVVNHLITSFTWNPIPATAHCFVRAVTRGIPHPIQLEEYPIFALNLAYFAGSMGLPYVATKTLMGSGFDHEKSKSGVTNRLRFERSPFNGERVCLVPPIRHDVGIVQVQRSDPYGNGQVWGMRGETRYGIQSCDRIIICAEEIVDTDVVMRDPNRTLVPAFRVQAVVEAPWGGHPQPLSGCYDMDWTYFAYYEQQTRTEEKFQDFLKKWVFGAKDRQAYLALLGEERLKGLRPEPFVPDPISYGRLTRHFEAPHD